MFYDALSTYQQSIQGGETLIILIFGVSNVGKTAIGKRLSKKLNYSFFDLDHEIKVSFQTTLEKFMEENPWPYERYKKKGDILKKIITDNEDNMVIAVSPIYDARNFNSLLDKEQVIAVELQDTEEHIFERLVFTDENDNICRDDEYKNAHKDYYIREIHEDIVYVRKTFKKIRWKYFIDNKSVDQAAEELFEMVPEKFREMKGNSGRT